MKRTLIASAAFASLLTATSAFAADLAVYPKAPVAAVYDWTGFYIGTNVGYSWGRGSTDGTFTGAQRVTTSFAASPAQIISDVPTPLPGGLLSGRADANGFIGGAQLGYNWQAGSFLYGLESDIQASGEGGTGNVCTVGGCPAGSAVFSRDYKLNWFGTARGRVGYLAAERLLLYVTGGFAYGGITANSPTLAYTFTALRPGWTAGAGAEAALGSNWSVKFEFLYMDLGNGGNSSAIAATSVSQANVPTQGQTRVTQQAFTYLFNTRFTDSIARVGLNYKFGGPVVARY